MRTHKTHVHLPWTMHPGDPIDRIVDAKGQVVCSLRSSGPRDAFLLALIVRCVHEAHGLDVNGNLLPATGEQEAIDYGRKVYGDIQNPVIQEWLAKHRGEPT